MTIFNLLTLIAILVGPIAAVIVTRHIDAKRDNRNRKMEIFRTLMRTRRQPTSIQHVEALNLVEIEFSDCEQIKQAFTVLFEHFATQHPRLPTEEVNDAMELNEVIRRNSAFDTRIHNDRQAQLARLLHAIAKELKFSIEQLEIFEGGYRPQGWADLELDERVIRKYVTDLYLGRRTVPVTVFDATTAQPGNRQRP